MKQDFQRAPLSDEVFSCHQGSIDKEEQALACLRSDASSLVSVASRTKKFLEKLRGIPVLVGVNQGIFPFVTPAQASSGSKHLGLQRNQRAPAWIP